MIAIKKSQSSGYRLYSTTLRDRLLKGVGLQNTPQVKIPEEHLPRLYANAVDEIRKVEGQTYGDYANSEVIFNWQDDYEFIEKIGRGRYSEVFKG